MTVKCIALKCNKCTAFKCNRVRIKEVDRERRERHIVDFGDRKCVVDAGG